MVSPAPLQIKFNAEKAMKQLGQMNTRQQRRFKLAVENTMVQAGAEIKTRVSKDISGAGNFSGRWSSAFTVQNRFAGYNAIMTTFFDSSIPYAHIHEFGGVIRGRPLMWIPLSWNSFKGRAREYPGQLFRVERPGRNPLLFSMDDKQAKYVGVTQVALRPRFHIRSIVKNVVRTQLAKLFARYVQGVKL